MSSKNQNIIIEGKTLPIREFKFEYMCKNPTIAIIAKRGSGKSFLCREIVNFLNREKMPAGAIISPTERMNPFYSDFFPNLFLHHKFEPRILENIFERQDKILQKQKEKKKQGKKVDPRALLIMDDCMGSKTSWVKDPNIQELFFNGRHYKLTFILTMQFPLGIGPDLRGNFDYIFLLAENMTNNQKRLYDHYAGMFPNLDSFKEVFQKITKNYGVMVIVNRGNAKNIWDQIFWFRAKDINLNDFGSKQFKLINNRNYDPQWKSRSRNPSTSLLPRKRGAGPPLRVNLIQ
jgi:hypothetical protein